MGLGIRHKLFEIPDDKSPRSLGKKKRSRGGRYAKAKSAWERQENEEEGEDAGTAFACSQAADPCCYLCGSTKSIARNRIVLCDGFDMGFRQKGLVPPLRQVPEGTWHCSLECSRLSDRAL